MLNHENTLHRWGSVSHSHVKGLTCLGIRLSWATLCSSMWCEPDLGKCVRFMFAFHQWSSWRSSETKQQLMVFVYRPCWLCFIQSVSITGASYLIRCPIRAALLQATRANVCAVQDKTERGFWKNIDSQRHRTRWSRKVLTEACFSY